MKPEARIEQTIGGHTLRAVKYGGRWSFSCPSWPDLAEKYDGCDDASECLDLFEGRATAAPPDPAPARQPTLLDFLAAPTLDDNAPHLARVRGRIGAAVLAFLRARLAAGAPEFTGAELREAVARAACVAPASPDRVLRDARQRGDCRYAVVNRRASRYRVAWVAEAKPDEEAA